MSTDAIELMLADLGWTRRLATSLARDGAEADDLWSETWSAARREQKKVHRGWIATTMRNVVRLRRRAETRRQWAVQQPDHQRHQPHPMMCPGDWRQQQPEQFDHQQRAKPVRGIGAGAQRAPGQDGQYRGDRNPG